MLTREEFEGAALVFKDELSAICLQQTEQALRALPGFETELREALRTLRDPEARAVDVLTAACGLIDEFASLSWDSVVRQTYELYQLRAKSGGDMPPPGRRSL